MHNTIADYLPATHEFKIVAPTPELHERARGLPAAREHKKEGCWVVPASPATAARIARRYVKRGLDQTVEFHRYWTGRVAAYRESQQVLKTPDAELSEIPHTRVQPAGKWLHQRRAFWFAHPLEAAMLDVTMGGGKTKVAIDLLLNWRAGDVLVISPLAAIEDAWEPGLEKHMTRPYALAALNSGTMAKKKEIASNTRALCPFTFPHRILLVNHESFWREPFATWACSVQWDLVIADEIHREKSAGSLSSKYLHRLGMRARRRLGLTGTMMPHSPLDVYGQFRFLDRGIFGTNVARFQERYGIFGGYEDREIVGFRRLRDLNRRVSTITIHIDDTEQDLPKTIDVRHTVKLEPAAKRMYQEMDKEFMVAVQDGHMTAANSGVKLLRLHQLACGIATMDRGPGERKSKTRRVSVAKLHGLRDILQDLAREEPVVIFVRFRPDIEAILDLCGILKRSASEMSGTANELPAWKAGRTDTLVAQIQAVKEGVDLTRSAFGIFYSTGISLGDYLQCRKRLHRPPQSRMVRFIHLLASGTKDVSTMRALEERHDVIKSVLKEVGNPRPSFRRVG
jgi:superfamily II DNA or RNA helicase